MTGLTLGDIVTRDYDHGQSGQFVKEVVFTFAEPGKKRDPIGKITVKRQSYGLEFKVNGVYLGVIDLFHYSKEGHDCGVPEHPPVDISSPDTRYGNACCYPLLIIHEPYAEDPLATVEWHDGEAQIEIARPSTYVRISHQNDYETTIRVDLEEKEPEEAKREM